jgi:hypothetical protein
MVSCRRYLRGALKAHVARGFQHHAALGHTDGLAQGVCVQSTMLRQPLLAPSGWVIGLDKHMGKPPGCRDMGPEQRGNHIARLDEKHSMRKQAPDEIWNTDDIYLYQTVGN